ncbi:MAG: hypothetical protein GY795_03880 [Desulfobacterales bacterium]|nr:hypothetical protein [Desulfobacterales bacterium]
MHMFRTITMIIMICFLTVGCDFGSIESDSDTDTTSEMTLTYSGSGYGVSEDFWCNECDAVFESEEGDFTASLMKDGTHTAVAYIAVGNGLTTSKHIGKGTYYFSVEGTGGWSVSITGDCDKFSEPEESVVMTMTK